MSTSYLLPQDRGRGFARVATVIAKAGDLSSAHALACEDYGHGSAVALFLKTAVGAANTGDQGWAGLFADGGLTDDFLSFARSRSIVEQLAPSMRRVEPLTRVVTEVANSIVAGWTGQGRGKALSSAAFDSASVDPHKLATICVLTEEVLRSSAIAELAIRDVMAAAVSKAQDEAFLDDAPADVHRPAGILNAITPTPSSGNLSADVATLIGAFEGDLSRAVLITTPATGAAIGLQNSFLDAGARGGSIAGLPLLVTNHLASDSSGDLLVLLDPSQVLIALGDIEISSAKSATVQMDTLPSQDSVTPLGTTTVSLFQSNSTGLRIERFISWALAREGAVSAVSGVAYSAST